MWSIRCNLVFLTASMLTFSAVIAPFCVFAVDEIDARSAIAVAEERIAVCYQAVADADEAGANTTDLLANITEAGWLLSRARLAYERRDFNSTVYFADQSLESLKVFVAEADVLREAAIQQRYLDFIVNVVGSTVGTAVVICGGFVVWFFLKRMYEKTGSVVS